jgi:hypothetical protein
MISVGTGLFDRPVTLNGRAQSRSLCLGIPACHKALQLTIDVLPGEFGGESKHYRAIFYTVMN